MLVKDYNKEFLPKINRANYFIENMNGIVDHMDKEKVDTDEIWRIFSIYGWSEELKNNILTALEYYRVHEGIEKLDLNKK